MAVAVRAQLLRVELLLAASEPDDEGNLPPAASEPDDEGNLPPAASEPDDEGNLPPAASAPAEAECAAEDEAIEVDEPAALPVIPGQVQLGF
jgi:hypothetical protein